MNNSTRIRESHILLLTIGIAFGGCIEGDEFGSSTSASTTSGPPSSSICPIPAGATLFDISATGYCRVVGHGVALGLAGAELVDWDYCTDDDGTHIAGCILLLTSDGDGMVERMISSNTCDSADETCYNGRIQVANATFLVETAASETAYPSFAITVERMTASGSGFELLDVGYEMLELWSSGLTTSYAFYDGHGTLLDSGGSVLIESSDGEAVTDECKAEATSAGKIVDAFSNWHAAIGAVTCGAAALYVGAPPWIGTVLCAGWIKFAYKALDLAVSEAVEALCMWRSTHDTTAPEITSGLDIEEWGMTVEYACADGGTVEVCTECWSEDCSDGTITEGPDGTGEIEVCEDTVCESYYCCP